MINGDKAKLILNREKQGKGWAEIAIIIRLMSSRLAQINTLHS